jgi:hypothetical protein
MIVVTKVNLVFNEKPFVARAFKITHVELAFFVLSALAPFVVLAREGVFGTAAIVIEPFVYVRPARCFVESVAFEAVVLARHSCDGRACINDQGLLLAL